MINRFVKITEVGPRDGLQNESTIVPTELKYEFIKLLLKSGLKNLESTSFVRPERIPQLSDAKELSELIPDIEKLKCIALVPNLKGYENAIKNQYKRIAVFTAASETFCKKNINMSIQESLEIIQKISFLAKSDGVSIRLYISTVAHCPYEGYIEPSEVLNIIQKLEHIEPYEISLGDTIGLATPQDLEKLFNLLLLKFNPENFAGHYHDTYGFALANIQKSLELGIRSFDSSVGGLGGCPYAKGASGNLSTEDLLFYLNRSGYDTGIEIEDILKASAYIEGVLKKPHSSRAYRALISK